MDFQGRSSLPEPDLNNAYEEEFSNKLRFWDKKFQTSKHKYKYASRVYFLRVWRFFLKKG